MKSLLVLLAAVVSLSSASQKVSGKYLADSESGCQVWVAGGYTPADSLSIQWNGNCKSRKADGYGTLVWYVKRKEVSRYVGFMQFGNPEGKGSYDYGSVTAEGNFHEGLLHGNGRVLFKDGRKLEGNFSEGEFLNLDERYLRALRKTLLSEHDSSNLYINDNGSTQLYYHALIPQAPKGVLVLLPGTWDRTEYVLSSNKKLAQDAFDRGIAVIVPSINQRLVFTPEVLRFFNGVFRNAIDTYQLPAQNFVLGGFSMGGLFSLRYTEMAYEDSTATAVVPKAVYSVDGPVDLENLYRSFQRSLEANPNAAEPRYGINEFTTFIGGSPGDFHDNYVRSSAFSKSESNGGNARYLQKVPLRIYNDVDVNWWLENRGRDLYDMNALDQSAMINLLQKLGNKNAEFINAFGKGFRLEGNRHPHSWSIVDAQDCLNWISKQIGL